MTSIYWLGAGLSSQPGIQRLARFPTPLIIVDSTPGLAHQSLGGEHQTATAIESDWQGIKSELKASDIVVSMLPTACHQEVAQFCIDRQCHFVCASYLTPELQMLGSNAVSKGVSLVAEVGLDPGLDHLFAHKLVARYRASQHCNDANTICFRSYCGGFPAVANPFTYKFSWSPVGVLKALNSAARWISDGEIQQSEMPWRAVHPYAAFREDGTSEPFEVYPNRDSLPYQQDYGFDPSWNIQEFVRGSLRLPGWERAWQPVFDMLTMQAEKAEPEILETFSQRLFEEHRYAAGEADRVVLRVELQIAERDNQTLWHEVLQYDVVGTEQGSAMARLVSLPVSLTVEQIVRGEMQAGVNVAPSEPEQIDLWLAELAKVGLKHEHLILMN